MTREELWTRIQPVINEEGVTLFDLDMPGKFGGTLRLFIAKDGGEEVGVADCVRVSRRVEFILDSEDLIPQGYLLEVSSPGINRRLRLPEHFAKAVGERLKVVLADGQQRRVVVGKLESFNEGCLNLQDETSGELVRAQLGEVVKARVEFLFV